VHQLKRAASVHLNLPPADTQGAPMARERRSLPRSDNQIRNEVDRRKPIGKLDVRHLHALRRGLRAEEAH
jgi:hypothetical protein